MDKFKIVPVVPPDAMLDVLHERVLISVDSRKREANILNDKAWWAAVVEAAPVIAFDEEAERAAAKHNWLDVQPGYPNLEDFTAGYLACARLKAGVTGHE